MLKQLKIETTTLHLQAEEKNKAKYIIDHSISFDDYCELLRENSCVYAFLEEYISHHKNTLHPILRAFAGTSKSDALRKDLDSSDCSKKDLQLDKPDLTAAPNGAELVGMLYVIEGSMLGGMYISRHIDKCPQLEHLPQQSFFNGNAKEVTRRWKSFSDAVGSLEWTEDEVAAAVATARLSFGLFNEAYA